MDEKEIFLVRYSELKDCIKNQSLKNMLNLSLVLRQLLLEGLIDSANKEFKLSIEFEVGLSAEERAGEMRFLGLPIPDLHFLGMFPPADLRKKIKRDDFLNFKVISYKKSFFSAKELIRVCSNSLGGVHFRNKTNDTHVEADIRELGTMLRDIGLQNGAFSTLIIIGKIVCSALTPLANSIKQ